MTSLMIYPEIAKKISSMMADDDQLREELIEEGVLFDGYHPRMEAMHNLNCEKLKQIIAEIGLPTSKKVGVIAAEEAWRLIMHSISHPDFMRSCLQLMKQAIQENEYEFKLAATLEDRICVYEGRPQIYGTNFDFDENDVMNATEIADVQFAEKARAQYGMLSLAEATKRHQSFNYPKPRDPEAKQAEFLKWTKRAGWRT